MKVFITGGSGFIGSHLVNDCIKNNHEVFNYDFKKDKAYNILNKKRLVAEIIKFEPDIVYHTAGQVFLYPGEEQPYQDNKLNTHGMLNLLSALEGTNINMIYTSTGAVYGMSGVPHKETMLPKPICNYGISKLAAEFYLQKWVKIKGVNAKIVRFSSVYGARRLAGPVNIFISQALTGKPITVYGTGNQTRDFIYVGDVVSAMKSVHEHGAQGNVYNIGTEIETSVLSVAKLIKLKHFPDTEIKFIPDKERPYELLRSKFDCSKLKSLGWESRVELSCGVSLTLNDLDTGYDREC